MISANRAKPRLRMTSPNVRSAPLPEEWESVTTPLESTMLDEARRAALELIWALHKQRAAWTRLARVKAGLDERNITYIDNERAYLLANGDVKWWRAEVASRSAALSALLAAAEFFYPPAEE